MSIPPVDVTVKAPVSDSCNCCEKVSCNLTCCLRRAKTPIPKEESKVHEFVHSFPLVKRNSLSKEIPIRRTINLTQQHVDEFKAGEKK